MKWLLAISIAFTVFSAQAKDNQKDEYPKEANVYGYMPTQDGFELLVESNGCTDKSSFMMVMLESFPVQMHVVRKVADTCEMERHLKKLTYTYKELGLNQDSQFYLINKLQVTSTSQLIQ
ncbi:MAG: hypothetical protein KDD61_02120 [Bdellovibrionales bacterium]|nr:hypothetical protein [Bdellovibrionales bacterium]